jgi:hypothetical protein
MFICLLLRLGSMFITRGGSMLITKVGQCLLQRPGSMSTTRQVNGNCLAGQVFLINQNMTVAQISHPNEAVLIYLKLLTMLFFNSVGFLTV